MEEVIAVVGLGFGDEGKGAVTDYLAANLSNPLVVRFCGGHQAGHTVAQPGFRHVFSNYGSGTYREVATFWSKYCTFDPVGAMNEYGALRSKGTLPVLYVDAKSPVTTPHDKCANRRDQKNLNDGTVGVGFGKTLKREEAGYSLTFEDLAFMPIVEKKLELIRDYYGPSSCKDYSSVAEFLNACEEVNNTTDIREGHQRIMRDYSSVIFEGAQGLMIDKDIGFFPHVTMADIGPGNIRSFTYVDKDPAVWFVTRAYQTRHGNGPMTNESIPIRLHEDADKTNKTGKYQGFFRTSVLDLDLLRYAIKKKYKRVFPYDRLVVTCSEHVIGKYKFTKSGKVYEFDDLSKFTREIGLSLNFDSNQIITMREHKIL